MPDCCFGVNDMPCMARHVGLTWHRLPRKLPVRLEWEEMGMRNCGTDGAGRSQA